MNEAERTLMVDHFMSNLHETEELYSAMRRSFNQINKSTTEESEEENGDNLESKNKKIETATHYNENLVKRTKATKDGKIEVLKMKPVILNFYACTLCFNWRTTSAKEFEKHASEHMDQNHKTIEEKTQNHKQMSQKSTLNAECKPKFSYAQLIVQAILQAPEMQITLLGIYNYVSENYPYYKKYILEDFWRNAIRHNLSTNRYFVKVPQLTDDLKPRRQKTFWTIDPAFKGYNKTIRHSHEEEKCGKNHEPNEKNYKTIEGQTEKHDGNLLYEQMSFQCNLCKKKYTQSRSLKLHISKVHEGTKSKVQRCEQVPEKRTDCKPPFSYLHLIFDAISQAPKMQITLYGIYKYISKTYPYYKMSKRRWKKTIKNNLKTTHYFVSQQLSRGKRSLWMIDPAFELSAGEIGKGYSIKRKRHSNQKISKKKMNPDTSQHLSHRPENYVQYEHNYCLQGDIYHCDLCKKKNILYINVSKKHKPVFSTEKQLLMHICVFHQPSIKLDRIEFEKKAVVQMEAPPTSRAAEKEIPVEEKEEDIVSAITLSHKGPSPTTTLKCNWFCDLCKLAYVFDDGSTLEDHIKSPSHIATMNIIEKQKYPNPTFRPSTTLEYNNSLVKKRLDCKKYSCTKCKTFYKSMEGFRNHVKEIHGIEGNSYLKFKVQTPKAKSNETNIKNIPKNSATIRYQFPNCDKSPYQFSSYLVHIPSESEEIPQYGNLRPLLPKSALNSTSNPTTIASASTTTSTLKCNWYCNLCKLAYMIDDGSTLEDHFKSARHIVNAKLALALQAQEEERRVAEALDTSGITFDHEETVLKEEVIIKEEEEFKPNLSVVAGPSEESDFASDTTVKDTQSVDLYECHVCNKHFNQYDLELHFLTHHSLEEML